MPEKITTSELKIAFQETIDAVDRLRKLMHTFCEERTIDLGSFFEKGEANKIKNLSSGQLIHITNVILRIREE